MMKQHETTILKYKAEATMHKTCVINDPLGQIHSLASNEHCFLSLCFVLLVLESDGRYVRKQ